VTFVGISPRCHEEHCITCSDEGVPMRVLDVDPATGLATCVDSGGGRSEIDVALVEPVAAGTTVLAHAGVAIALVEAAA
jgi:hydrogenase expression/formation protein HypC